MMMAWINHSVLTAVAVSAADSRCPKINQLFDSAKHQSCRICRSGDGRIVGNSQKYTDKQVIGSVTAYRDSKTPQQENTGKKQSGSGPEGKTEQMEGIRLRPDVVCKSKQKAGRHSRHHRRETARKLK
jgi:hypothetical protein